MKRTIFVFSIIFVFCLCGCTRSAIQQMPAQSESTPMPTTIETPIPTDTPAPTEKPQKTYSRTIPRNAIEYAQLYSSRLTEASMSWLKGKVNESDYKGAFYYTFIEDGYIIANASGALMQLNPYDLTIDECTIDFIDMDDDDQRGQRRFYCAFTAISALEFDVLDEDDTKMKYKYGLVEYSDAIDKAIAFFEQSFDADIFTRAKRSDVLIYSGNYDYYLTYFKTTDNNGKVKELYYLVAKAV